MGTRDDLQPSRQIVVYPGKESFPIARNVRAMGVAEAVARVMFALKTHRRQLSATERRIARGCSQRE